MPPPAQIMCKEINTLALFDSFLPTPCARSRTRKASLLGGV